MEIGDIDVEHRTEILSIRKQFKDPKRIFSFVIQQFIVIKQHHWLIFSHFYEGN